MNLITRIASVLAFVVCFVVATLDVLAEETNISPNHARQMKAGLELFRKQVGPILKKHCLKCHNPKRSESGFDLSTRQRLLGGGDLGTAVTVRNAQKSRLLRLIKHQQEPHMPLDSEQLSQQQITIIAQWINLGAPYFEPLVDSEAPVPKTLSVAQARQTFWAFQPLNSASTSGNAQSWGHNSIDAFIAKGMRERHVSPVHRADQHQLLRRSKLGVLGLPVTPDELGEFATVDRPDNWERWIEQLLSSPAFGERWARHWLDVVRFAESYGFEHDLDNDHAYHYRDFVIWTMNEDLPFDDFVRWQLAGDEICRHPMARLATGFLAAGVHNADIAKAGVEQERYNELDDIASTIGTSMLGLSIGCARCHDHKFDPISQQNYYQFIATFERTVRGEIDHRSFANSNVSKVLVAGEGVPPLARLYNPGPAFFTTTWFLRRGDTRLKSHEVHPSFLEVLTPVDSRPQEWRMAPSSSAANSTMRRAALANWITDVDRGAGTLLARVIVNRVWQHHFGRGIVATPSDFGARGSRPTHPRLLEYLAAQLIEHDWSLKHVHRLILSSATYQQAAANDGTPEINAATFRGHHRQRLDAEAIRDSMLALGSGFDQRMYGTGNLSETQPRRSIYFRVKRSQLMESMSLFDAPDALQGIDRRSTTTVAPQALALMNSTYVRKFADRFAQQLTATPLSQKNLVHAAFLQALGRRPSPIELRDSIQLIEELTIDYQRNQQSVVTAPAAPASTVCWLDATNLPDGPLAAWGDRSTNRLTFRPARQHKPTVLDDVVRFNSAPNFLSTADNPHLRFGTGDFTISIAFRMAEPSQLIGKDSYPGQGDSYTGYFIQLLGDSLRFSTRNLVDGKGPVNYLDSQKQLKRNVWYRVSAIRESNTLRLYFDEAHDVDRTINESSPTNVDIGTPLKIGEMDDHASGAFQGDLAEVLIYNRALSIEEVRTNHAYLKHKHLTNKDQLTHHFSAQHLALVDFCQALFCLNEFIYVE